MKLSVMMITYNHERFIAQAIRSVLAQRVNFDYEIVVGEDCSTDTTRDILMDFHRQYPDRIVPLLRNHNMGAMQNLDGTLAACRGQYLALIEGDDYWTCEDKLQRQVDFLDAHHDHAICCHRAQVLDETGKSCIEIQPRNSAGSYTIEDLLESNWIMTCSVVYRWGSIAALPSWFVDMKLGDWPLHVLVARVGKINLLDDVMAVYRVHPGSMWSSQPLITQLREITRMLPLLDKHLEFRYTDRIRRTLAHSYLEMALISRMEGDLKEMRRYLVDCLRHGGLRLPGRRRTLAALLAYSLRLAK
jgi:glycosyltransferase involved in cell wall biosynthesis